MGIMYATLPATLGVRPNGLRMAEVQYWVQVVGSPGLVADHEPCPTGEGSGDFGLLTLGALVIFVHNIAATVGRGKSWGLPEAHFIMAVFYLAVTGLIGMSYMFYLNSGYVPQTMVSLKVPCAFRRFGLVGVNADGADLQASTMQLGVDHVCAALGSRRQRADQPGILGGLLRLCLRLAGAAHRLCAHWDWPVWCAILCRSRRRPRQMCHR